MEASNLSILSRRIIVLLLYIDCQGGRTAAIAHHVSFAQITCFNQLEVYLVIFVKYYSSSRHCMRDTLFIFVCSEQV